MTMSKQTPGPMSAGSPYMPVITYTIAWPTVITMPNTAHTHKQITECTCLLVQYVGCLTQLWDMRSHWHKVWNPLKCPFYTALSSMVCTLQSHSWFHKNAPPNPPKKKSCLAGSVLVTLLPVKTDKFLYRHDLFLVNTNTGITCMVSNGAE